MLFNSFEFVIFLPIVFLLYWFVFGRSLKLQNLFLLVASYVFYAWWNWKLSVLLAGISSIAYIAGRGIVKSKYKKLFSLANIIVGVGTLWIFKYYNFFAKEFAELFSLTDPDRLLLHLVLPAGLSFFVLRSMSYTIELKRGYIDGDYGIVEVFTYIAFFPQLLAGPIAKAKDFLPQLSEIRVFKYEQGVDGLRQFLWGLFKKLVIADNCSVYVDRAFSDIAGQNGSTLLLAAVLYSIQIYADFSGYSDMAIGVGKLLGFSSKRNFSFPYFTRNIAEFWRKWHISLTSWFVEYVYIPLGGNRVPVRKVVFNTFVIFLISGLWHGANWTFIAWGGYHALLFVPLILTGRNKKYKSDNVAAGKPLPNMKELLLMLLTFLLATFGWIMFRADSIAQFAEYVSRMFSFSIFSMPYLGTLWNLVCVLPLFFIVEWVQRDKEHGLDLSSIDSGVVRYSIYFVMLCIIFVFAGHTDSFIYFQF